MYDNSCGRRPSAGSCFFLCVLIFAENKLQSLKTRNQERRGYSAAVFTCVTALRLWHIRQLRSLNCVALLTRIQFEPYCSAKKKKKINSKTGARIADDGGRRTMRQDVRNQNSRDVNKTSQQQVINIRARKQSHVSCPQFYRIGFGKR